MTIKPREMGSRMTNVARARGRKRFSLAFWIESVAGSLTGFLAILTLVWRDWIEGVFGYDPDHHNGSFEWELVIVCALLTLLFAALARREWRRARAIRSPAAA
jgi:hypothetical protein